MPLGLYLLSFYALKHRPRVSLFERVYIPLPMPWKIIPSILQSWTGPSFQNRDTGEITTSDPRRRAFPRQADQQPLFIRTREYMAAYNASPGDCTTFWGHCGRNIRTNIRFRPIIYRIGFVVLAVYYICKGFLNILFYNPPNVYEEILKHRHTIKKEDIVRIMKLLRLWSVFSHLGFLFVLAALVFAGACIGCILILWFVALWKYVPQEEKEMLNRMAQEYEETRREGRVRLE